MKNSISKPSFFWYRFGFFGVVIFLLAIFMGAPDVHAAARTASASGNWSSTSTWGGSSVPVAGDTVTINSGITVTVDVAAACTSITINDPAGSSNGVTISSTNSLTVSGAITTNAPSGNSVSTIAVGAGTLSAGSIALAGTTGAPARYTDLTVSTGSVTISGNLTSAGTRSRLTFTGVGTLNIAGTFMSGTAGTFTANSSTVNYTSSSAQSIAPFAYTFNNVTLSGSNTKTMTNATINGTLSIQGTATTGGTIPTYGTNAVIEYKGSAAQTTNNSAFTIIGANQTLKINNANGVSLNANKTINGTLVVGDTVGTSIFSDNGYVVTPGAASTVTIASGTYKLGSTTTGTAWVAYNTRNFSSGTTVEYAAGVAQNVSATPIYQNLIFSGAGAKTTAAGTIIIGGSWDTTGGTSTLNTNNTSVTATGSITGTGAITMGGGTINLKGNWTNSGTFTANTSTVNYSSASGGQHIGAVTYYNLTTGNTVSWDFADGTTTVNNILTTTAGGILNMATYPLTGTLATIANNGTIRTQNTSALPIPSGKTWGGTILYDAASGQAIVTGTYNNLTIDQLGGNTSIGGDINVSSTLSISNSVVSTSVYTVYINTAGGSVSRGSGYIDGNLKKYITTGATSKTFEVGNPVGGYSPVDISFGNVTAPGTLVIKTTPGAHPNIASSTLSTSKIVNRYWTATNSGVTFNNYNAVLNFVSGDVIGGANPSSFLVGKYDSGVWTYPTVGTKNATNTQITGVTSTFSDFIIAENGKTDPVLSVLNSPVVYNGSTQSANVTSTVPGTVSDVKYDGSLTVPTNVGTYAITADFVPDDTGNYNSLNDASAGTFSITPKPITVIADSGQTKVYGAVDPTFTYTSSDASTTFTGVLSRVAGEDVGSYAITTGTLAVVGSNYTFATFTPANFSITAKQISVTVNSGQTKVYGASDPALTYTASDASTTFSGALSRVTGEDVGSYAITTGTLAVVGSNYIMATFTPDNFSITIKPISVTVDAGQTKVYGAADPGSYAYTCSDASTTFSGSLSRTAGENVGSYLISTGTLAIIGSNYTMATFTPANFSITAKPITVTADSGQSKIIGAPDPVFTYTASDASTTFSGVLSRVAGEATGTPYAITTGTLAVVGTNYVMATFTSANFTIVDKLTPTLSVLNSPVFYDGSAQSAVVSSSVSGVISDVKYDGFGTVPTNVGIYAVTADFVPSDTSTYYSLSDASAGNFTINAKPITVTADSGQTKVFGTADPIFTYASSDASTTFSGNLSRASGENVSSTYAITVGSLAVVGTNYIIATFTPANFSITPKPITVTADSGLSKVYGAADPIFTYTSSDASTTFIGLLSRVTGENVSTTYAITIGSLAVSGNNYSIATFTPANFAVTAKPITVTVDSGQTKVYGSGDPSFTYTPSDPATFSGVLTRDPGEDAGIYAISIGSLAVTDSNYTMATFTPDNFTITAKPITVTVDPGQTKLFGAPDPTFTYTSSDPSATFSGLLDRIGGEATGTPFAIGIGTLAVVGTNYTIATFTPANFEIVDKYTPTLHVTNSGVVYNGSTQAAAVSASVAGTVSDVKYDGSGTVPSDEGTYVITADFLPTDTTTYNNLDDAGAGNFIIVPKDITVTVDSGQTKIVSSSDPIAFTYTSSDPSVTFTGALDRVAGEAVGSYAIGIGSLLPASSNYNIATFTPANFTITAKLTPTLSITNSPVTYNASSQAAAVSGSVAGVVSNVQYDGTSTVPVGAGTYAITADFAPTDTTTYNNLTGASAGNFIIDKETVTVTADAKSKLYGEADPTLTFTSSEPAAALTGSLSRVAGEPVGTYAITQGTLALVDTADYTLNYIGANLTITDSGGGSSYTPPPAVGNGTYTFTIPMGALLNIGNIGASGVNLLAFINSIADFIVLVSHNLLGEHHTLTIIALDLFNNTITFRVESVPQVFTLNLGGSTNVDLDGDKKADVSITFADININRAELTIKSLLASADTSGQGEVGCPTLAAGDMVKVVGKPAIYALNSALQVLYFPSGDEFKSWRPTYGGYISISQSCFDSLSVPSAYPAAVNYRPGSYVVKRPSSDQLYVVEPNNTLAKITAEAAAALYGTGYKVMTVSDVFWPHYVNRGTDITTASPHQGMLIKVDGVTYYVDAGHVLREVTADGMTANGFQTKFVQVLSGSTIDGWVQGDLLESAESAITNKTQ